MTRGAFRHRLRRNEFRRDASRQKAVRLPRSLRLHRPCERTRRRRSQTLGVAEGHHVLSKQSPEWCP